MTFLDGTVVLGSATVNASGVASLVVPSLGLGIHSISASYAGDPDYATLKTAATSVYSGDGLKDDFDGDGKADLAVYGKDPSTGRYRFKILDSSTGFAAGKATVFDNQGFGFGNAASIPVAADYFGDGKAAYAIFSPDGHGYMILQAISSANPGRSLSVDFGLLTDSPVVGDVDGDGKADFGVFGFDPNLGYRYDFLLSSKGFDPRQPLIFSNYGYGFGTPNATPVVGDFDGSGHAGFGVTSPRARAGRSPISMSRSRRGRPVRSSTRRPRPRSPGPTGSRPTRRWRWTSTATAGRTLRSTGSTRGPIATDTTC